MPVLVAVLGLKMAVDTTSTTCHICILLYPELSPYSTQICNCNRKSSEYVPLSVP